MTAKKIVDKPRKMCYNIYVLLSYIRYEIKKHYMTVLKEKL